jgi:hypothetical protein
MSNLNSDIFAALHKIMHLNPGVNNFSTLTVSVIAQLANVRNVVDLQGNTWVCDCLMYSTMLCVTYSTMYCLMYSAMCCFVYSTKDSLMYSTTYCLMYSTT